MTASRSASRPRAGFVFEARQTAELFAHLCSPEQCFVVDYGVHLDAIDRYRASLDRRALRHTWGYDENSIVLTVVGRSSTQGQATVLAAFDELAAVNDRLRLALVGSRPSAYTDGLRAQLARSAARDRVDLIPIVPDVYPWYAIADLLVCASDIESLPRSILEAMAFEVPIVSTDAFGIADLIDDGRTGWLTRARGSRGPARAAVPRVSDSCARAPSGCRARARVEVQRRHGDSGYGRIFARVLADLLNDPACELSRAFAPAQTEDVAP